MSLSAMAMGVHLGRKSAILSDHCLALSKVSKMEIMMGD